MAKRQPEQTYERILNAAAFEFADKGLSGARVDAIAERAGANKRMLYHYFGNKEALYLVVMEHAYEAIRTAEQELELESREPVDAIRELVRFTFNYFVEHPEFMRLLNNENLYNAQYIRQSNRIKALHFPLVGYIGEVLERGERQGLFRSGVDPVQLYISIAGIGYFYLSNSATLETIFDRDLHSEQALQVRLDHITAIIVDYLTTTSGDRRDTSEASPLPGIAASPA
ncbi:TetR/AcrR family transcriptional regulator [Microbaculum marinum]|uniref:TetR/AcrR family transcriptional regulator n=1 Tax=Microbaculum marinum TaxID=1764581 RepID=A0AAW9RSV1_9HYPH